MDFVQLMISKDFKASAELLFDSIMSVEVPNNVTINIDRQRNVLDLADQLKNVHSQIQEQAKELIENLSSTKIIDEVLSHETLKDKPIKFTREQLINVSNEALEIIVQNKIKKDCEAVFNSLVVVHQGAIKGLIKAAKEI